MKKHFFLYGFFSLISFNTMADEAVYRMPISLYLQPQSSIASVILAQSQMQVSPITNFNNLFFIVLREFTTTDRSCSAGNTRITVVGDASAVATSLTAGQIYTTTDASTFGVFGTGVGNYPIAGKTQDFELYFAGLDGDTQVGNASPCFQPSNITCNGIDDCGFNIGTVTWNP